MKAVRDWVVREQPSAQLMASAFGASVVLRNYARSYLNGASVRAKEDLRVCKRL
jgi:hypothetical protein